MWTIFKNSRAFSHLIETIKSQPDSKIDLRVIICRSRLFDLWHDGWHSFLLGGANQRIPLSVLAQSPHKGFAHEISNETGRKRGKASSRAVNRRKQSTCESSQQKSGEGDSQRKATAKQGCRTCGPRGRVGLRERMRPRFWWLCGNFARVHPRVHVRDSSQVHRKLQKSA